MKFIFSFIIILTGFNQILSQCYPDRHNTTWFHGWESCEKSENPNSARGTSHWIMYDLGHIYKLENVHFWNINDPENLNNGIKNVMIDYSTDGNSWIEFGHQSFNQGTGKSIYEGEDAFSFDGINARYLLVTVLENWGGSCVGFGEIKIGVSPITATELVNFDMNCDEKQGKTELTWSLVNESKTVNFDIEKSLDGTNWNSINSTGNISIQNGQSQYKYVDNSEEDAYYRIKVTEQNGKTRYTDAHFCSKSTIKAKAFPNPFNNNISVEILAQNNDPVVYKLTDVFGRVIKKGILNTNSVIHQLEFNGFDLVPGNYILNISQGSKSKYLNLIKMKNGE
ncbi:MAG TPA: T9SS type A sorting domain-containing protein [Bacteroidetes bacterium]|nr:T9SS type A sorting domain-containing protein [Bacteroidota bacterium]